MKNKGITLVALVITIIILLILAGISISQLTGSGLFEKAKLAKEKSIKAEMEEELTLAMQELQLEKIGKATINDVTEEFFERTIQNEKFEVTLYEIENDKIVKIKQDHITGNYMIDENLNIIEIEEIQDNIELTYDLVQKTDNKLSILVYIQEKEKGISKIEFPNEDVLTCGGTTKKIAKDYEVEIGKEYKVKITLENGKVEEKTILIEIPTQIEIYSNEDFERFKQVVNSGLNASCNAKLMKDIELNSSDTYETDEAGKIIFKEEAKKYTSIGTVNNPYSGVFDGNGKEIVGLYMNDVTVEIFGLFGMISQEGEVKNIILKNSSIYGRRIGGIVGYNEGKIYRCKVENTTIENTYSYGSRVGGIAAVNNGKIVECSTNVYMYGSCAGGIVGENGTADSRNSILTYNSTVGKIYRCFSNGYLGNSEVGSIASHNGVYGGKGEIYDCYSIAKMEDNYWNGAIVAVQTYQGEGGYIYNSYYLNLECNFPTVVDPSHFGTVNNSYSNDVTVTATKLNGESSTAWVDDTKNINNGYPVLSWQME